jgi:hypothetical protein
MIAHLFAGLAGWAQDENGALTIVPVQATELPAAVINDDGTVTYVLTEPSVLSVVSQQKTT